MDALWNESTYTSGEEGVDTKKESDDKDVSRRERREEHTTLSLRFKNGNHTGANIIEGRMLFPTGLDVMMMWNTLHSLSDLMMMETAVKVAMNVVHRYYVIPS